MSSLMSCLLSSVEHAKSLRPSSLLNAFFLISLLLDAALLRTLWISSTAGLQAITAISTAAFALKAVVVLLEAQGKTRYLSGPASPEITAGLYAQAVFAWVVPLLANGFRRLLKPADLPTLDEDMGAAGLSERFWWHWGRQVASTVVEDSNKLKTHASDVNALNTLSESPARKQRLIRCCVITLGWSLVAVVIPRLVLLAFTICQPLVLNRFLLFLDDRDQPVTIGYGLIGAYGLIYIGIALSQALYWHRNARSVTMLRGLLVSAVFSKATRMSITATDDSAAVTLMSSDVCPSRRKSAPKDD